MSTIRHIYFKNESEPVLKYIENRRQNFSELVRTLLDEWYKKQVEAGTGNPLRYPQTPEKTTYYINSEQDILELDKIWPGRFDPQILRNSLKKHGSFELEIPK